MPFTWKRQLNLIIRKIHRRGFDDTQKQQTHYQKTHNAANNAKKIENKKKRFREILTWCSVADGGILYIEKVYLENFTIMNLRRCLANRRVNSLVIKGLSAG